MLGVSGERGLFLNQGYEICRVEEADLQGVLFVWRGLEGCPSATLATRGCGGTVQWDIVATDGVIS